MRNNYQDDHLIISPCHLVQSAGDEDLLEDLLVHGLLVRDLLGGPGGGLTLQSVQPVLPVLPGVHHPVKQLPKPQHRDVKLSEELREIAQILPEELQSVRMVVLHGLTHVDDEGLALVVEHVVLGQVSVDQLALVIHFSYIQ